MPGGLLWNLSERWEVAGFYRQGPELDFEFEVRTGPAITGLAPGTVLRSVSGPIALPDVFGLGIAYRWRDERLTLAFEWDRVQYSDLVDSTLDQIPEQSIFLDDGEELHLGAEYVLPRGKPIVALRLGAWLDPDHRGRYTGDDLVVRAIVPRGEDELHLAVGFGLAFERFQIDFGLDVSDPLDTISVSRVYGF